MGILKGLYQSKHLRSISDNYGGNSFKTYYYTYLHFSGKNIHFFKSVNPHFEPGYHGNEPKSFDDSEVLNKLPDILQKARMLNIDEYSDKLIRMSATVRRLNEDGEQINDKQLFFVTVAEQGQYISVKAWYESNPTEIWLEDEFNHVDN